MGWPPQAGTRARRMPLAWRRRTRPVLPGPDSTYAAGGPRLQSESRGGSPERAKARNPTVQRMTDRVATLAQAHDSDGHSCRLSRGKAAAE